MRESILAEQRLHERHIFIHKKNGEGVDVLSEGCDFDVSYTCNNYKPDEKFQFRPDGRFKKIQ